MVQVSGGSTIGSLRNIKVIFQNVVMVDRQGTLASIYLSEVASQCEFTLSLRSYKASKLAILKYIVKLKNESCHAELV